MTSEVKFLIDTLASVVTAQSEPLRRIDRDETKTFVGDATVANTPDSDIIETAEGRPRVANYVSIAFTDETTEAIGTEYDHDIERTCNVRIEGVDVAQGGHIDPTGANGVPFTGQGGLVDAVRDAIMAERTFPSAGDDGVAYHSLRFANAAPDSAAADFAYRYEVDVVFEGFETLP